MSIPPEELEKALDGELLFDGSSIEGFARVEESDMYLVPDPKTFGILPWHSSQGKSARLICDIYGRDGKPFEGCPRYILKQAIKKAKDLGFTLNVGPEGEFFLFHTDERGRPVFDIHDDAGYFDLSPIDFGEKARRDMIRTLRDMGFHIEASHHEVAPGQHEIDFKYNDALNTADNFMTFKYVVKNVAKAHGLYASFMPKPFPHQNGNAMHCNQSLFADGKNSFFDPDTELQLSETALHYIGGILEHAEELAAICNPTVNSYKRLQPGYEAPVNICWSESNRSSLIRIPVARGAGTRLELRNPDPTANPYLVFACILSAGMDGITKRISPPPPIEGNLDNMCLSKKKENGVRPFPRDLYTALEEMKKSELVYNTLGKHSFKVFIKAKTDEWLDFNEQVHSWEINNYLRY